MRVFWNGGESSGISILGKGPADVTRFTTMAEPARTVADHKRPQLLSTAKEYFSASNVPVKVHWPSCSCVKGCVGVPSPASLALVDAKSSLVSLAGPSKWTAFAVRLDAPDAAAVETEVAALCVPVERLAALAAIVKVTTDSGPDVLQRLAWERVLATSLARLTRRELQLASCCLTPPIFSNSISIVLGWEGDLAKLISSRSTSSASDAAAVVLPVPFQLLGDTQACYEFMQARLPDLSTTRKVKSGSHLFLATKHAAAVEAFVGDLDCDNAAVDVADAGAGSDAASADGGEARKRAKSKRTLFVLCMLQNRGPAAVAVDLPGVFAS